MRTLRFIVDGQTIRKDPDCDFSGLVAGSVGYLRANFKFSKEWFGCVKAASFWYSGLEHGALLDALDSCMIPEEALNGEQFQVSVTGVKSGFKIRTSITQVRQEVCE